MAFNGRIPEDLQARIMMPGKEGLHRAAHVPEPGAPMFDYMLDLETTGLNANENGILQIACVRFNRLTKEVDPNWFDQCLTLPTGRYWDEGTRDWWMDRNADVLRTILPRARPYRDVLAEFDAWVRQGSSIMQKALWCKPTTFDYPFIAAYFRQMGLPMPFHYREAVDLNSYLLGRGHENRKAFWDTIPSDGPAHNAIEDCLFQIRAVFNA